MDGKEIYNTIRRKTKDAFYKNIVKKGYLLKKSELCLPLFFFKGRKKADKDYRIIEYLKLGGAHKDHAPCRSTET